MNTEKPVSFARVATIFPWVLILIILYFTRLYSYLLFHSLVEIFSIAVACAIFMFAWNSQRFLENHYFLFIGIAYLFIAGMDIIHTLAYADMNVFKGYETNLPTQLWIAARYMESISFLLAPRFFVRRLRIHFVFFGYILVTCLLLSAIFYWHIFPVCFSEETGLTAFKKVSEYIISLILLSSIFLLFKRRELLDEKLFRLVVWSILMTIGSELAFTLYVSPYGHTNLIGHYLKFISFCLIYKAVIETGLTRPFDLLFRNMKKTEETLRKSEEQFRAIFENAPIGIDIVDKEGLPLYVNPALQKMLGYSEDKLQSMPFTDFTHPDDLEGSLNLVRSLLDGESDSLDIEKRYYRKDGGLVWAHTTVSVVRDDNGVFQHFIAMVKDITERKRDEEALRKSETQLRILTTKLTNLKDEGRRYIAQELHDQVGQNLSALNIKLNMVKNQLPKETQIKIVEHLDDSLGLLRETTQRIRNIMSELRPELLDDYGLLTALRRYGEEFSVRFGIDVKIKGEELTPRLPLQTETGLYYIAKEAMINVSKHAQASCITISLEKFDGRFRLTLADNGRGFDPDLTGKTDKQNGWGLLIMKERVRAIGGQLIIDSSPEKGTKIVVEFKK